MLGGSAGRATGRPPPVKELDGLGAAVGAGVAARAAGLGAAFGAAALAGAVFRLAGALRFAVARLAVVFFGPGPFAVLFFSLLRFAVDFFPPAPFAVRRLAGGFFLFQGFFFAGLFSSPGAGT